MPTRNELLEQIDVTTKEIWEKGEHTTIPHHEVIDLGWHGGYKYSIVDGELIYPFAEPLKYLDKRILEKILDVLNEF